MVSRRTFLTATGTMLASISGCSEIGENEPEPLDVRWKGTYSTGDSVHSMIETSNDEYLLAGRTDNHRAWLVKADDSGNRLWKYRYIVNPGVRSNASSVIETSDGGYVFTGNSDEKALLAKVDVSGTEQWNQTYGRERFEANPISAIETSDGSYLLAGKTSYDSGDAYYTTWAAKIDTSGETQWTGTYGGYAATSVIETSNGGYLLAGYIDNGEDIPRLVKIDRSGTKQWIKTYDGNPSRGTYSVIETSNGYYLLTDKKSTKEEGQDDSLNREYELMKTNTSGNVQWTRSYGEHDLGTARSIVEMSNGGYLLAGQTEDYDGCVVKVDTSGAVQWKQSLGDSIGYIGSAIEAGDNKYVLAGTYSGAARLLCVEPNG